MPPKKVPISTAKGMPDFDTELDPTTIGIRWTKWFRGFKRYIGAEGIEEVGQQVVLLLHNGGEKVQDIWDVIDPKGDRKKIGENDEDDYTRAVRLLTEHFQPQINTTYERHLFRNMSQNDDESMDQYVCRLAEKAMFCKFTDTDEQIRDQAINGCK